MKKLYFLLFTILISVASFGQTTLAAQDFEGASGDTWTFIETPGTYNVSGDVWANVTSVGTITNPQNGTNFWGMQDLENTNGGGAFDHTLAFSNVNVSGQTNILLTFYFQTVGFDSTDTIRVEFFFDDVSQGEESMAKDTGGAWSLFSKVVPDGTSSVRFTILARQNGGSDYAGIDNILLESGAVTDPSLSIIAPTEGETVNSGTAGFNATLDVQNFTVSNDNGMGASDNSGDGYIQYTIDSDAAINKFDASAIVITGLSAGPHSLTVELVDNSGMPLTPAVSSVVNFTVNNIVQNLPYYEGFDYTVGQNLGDQNIWSNINSGDDIVIAGPGGLTYTGLAGNSQTGNHVTFDGSGMESKLEFTPTTLGPVYSSFLLNVADLSAITDLADGGYIAALAGSDFGYDVRVWVRPNTDPVSSTYDMAITSLSSSTDGIVFSGTYSEGNTVLVVMSYDPTNGSIKGWINPTSLGGAEPAPDFTETDANPTNVIDRFFLRQDSAGETPSLLFDELRIGTTYAQVTPMTLSNVDVRSFNFSLYPNPTSEGYVNISTVNNDDVQVAVYDILGKQVKNETLKNERLDVSNLKSGVYLLRLTQNEATVTKKLVIN
ncbi:T9SS type A sorting domain-containing protein [Winogradskyella maritima]|uniref:T9SS type A sorting domain-containing protein n=1 Tax=Winogradskyella maritima TaxID=1517766 RepID=A0ABV8AHW0_9FLAO|nr:T9SS type A sorting domain-containing protein [Winogradskyella maritima]